jgi:hypothetical protein
VDDPKTLAGAGAAEATLKRSWGWDESPSIVIRFTLSDTVLTLDPRFENKIWHVYTL